MKRFVLAATTIIGVLLIIGLDRYQVSTWHAKRHQELTREAQAMHLRLENSLESRVNTARHLGAFVQARGRLSEEEFTVFARQLLEYNRSVRALQLTDETTQVIYVYPPAGNRITITDPMVLIEDPLRGGYVREAIERRSMTIQSPFELRQGGLGIVARNPVFTSGAFRGLAIAVLDVPVMIEEAFPGLLQSSYRANLTDSDGNLFFTTIPENAGVVTHAVSFADTEWTLDFAFAEDRERPPVLSRLIVYGLGSGALGLLLVLISFLYRHEEDLERQIVLRTAELQQSEERFRIVADYTADWEYWILPDGALQYVSPSIEEITGYEAEAFTTGREILETLIHPDDREAMAPHLSPKNGSIPASSMEVLNVRIVTKAGETRWIGHHSRTVYIGEGTFAGRRASNRDITAEIRLKADQETLLDEKETLMRELNHRVKNNLAMITSLVNLKEASLDETVDLSDIAHQIDTIRVVHETFYKTSRVSRIDIREYLVELLESAFSFQNVPVRIDEAVTVSELPTRIAIPLGLITNEVATNAMKYSFVSGEPAVFTVAVDHDDDRTVCTVTLTHSGAPFPEDIGFDHPETLGLRLIKELTDQIDGTVELTRRPSPRFTIRFPG
ncbi:MAG: PAS domain S-box protein [Spirochaeta sp.]|nr:PAS domain S-box protein [Spirochaeta sp.]